ncbi:hypothetical protein CK203_085516 [Vitis vinifera]|uniref:Uncharacterized protein n=1 Tax=Vitis vinifera TaxID=29760 RepID=A0A438C2L0_VITVI|nr:hypothetical protein CK203_085516 [Vitis vinifera]
MDQRVVAVDQFTTAMASIQEASASLKQEIDSQQSRQFVVQDETPYDSLPPPLWFEQCHLIYYMVILRELTLEDAAWLMDLDGNRFSKPTIVDQLENFYSFLLPYHPSLRYVPCLKTTLRPWDQMSSLTASTWTGPIQLCSDYWDQPPRSIQLGPHFSTLRCHHASPSGRCVDSCFTLSAEYMLDPLYVPVEAFSGARCSGLDRLISQEFSVNGYVKIMFGVQSHHHFLVSASEPSSSLPSLTFRVTSSVLAFRAITVAFSILAFRAIITSSFGVQNHHYHFSVSAFRAIIITS